MPPFLKSTREKEELIASWSDCKPKLTYNLDYPLDSMHFTIEWSGREGDELVVSMDDITHKGFSEDENADPDDPSLPDPEGWRKYTIESHNEGVVIRKGGYLFLVFEKINTVPQSEEPLLTGRQLLPDGDGDE
jgi:hypothetical protein